MRFKDLYLVSSVSWVWLLNILRWLGPRLASLGVLSYIGRFFKWIAGGSLLLSVGKKVLMWFITISTAGPLMKAFKIAGMSLLYFAILQIIGRFGFDSLISGFVSALDILPSQALCALKLLGFGDVLKIFASTAGAVGTIKLMLRLAGS